MSSTTNRIRKTIDRLDSCHMDPPSPALRTRVLQAARSEWVKDDPASGGLPWIAPCLRLAACLAVAFAVAAMANALNDRCVARWHHDIRRTEEVGGDLLLCEAAAMGLRQANLPLPRITTRSRLTQHLESMEELLRITGTPNDA